MTSKSDPTSTDLTFQHEWVIFNQRRFEAVEMQKTQLIKELQRQRHFNAKMAEEIDMLR